MTRLLLSASATLDGFALGSLPASQVVQNWQHDHIVYYRLLLDKGSPANGYFQYAAVSGRSFGTPIKDFITKVQAGDAGILPAHRLSAWEASPNIRAIAPCYVVVELDPDMDWYFLPGMVAIKTETECSPYYTEVRHVLKGDKTAANPFPGTLPGQPRTAPLEDQKCKIVYFAVLDPGDKAVPGSNYGRIDLANFYTQAGNGPGGLVVVIVDPDIKNNGGDQE